MSRAALVLCAIVCVGIIGCKSGGHAEFKVPAEAAAQKNPVPLTAESVAKGNELYKNAECGFCHGPKGDGKGSLAQYAKNNLHNWHDPAMQAKFTDGELFYIIDKGEGSHDGTMPNYHNQESPEQIWRIVAWIRSLSGAPVPS